MRACMCVCVRMYMYMYACVHVCVRGKVRRLTPVRREGTLSALRHSSVIGRSVGEAQSLRCVTLLGLAGRLEITLSVLHHSSGIGWSFGTPLWVGFYFFLFIYF
ncbi:hypothetical protein ANANG_G00201380 [Anguilla anguilla]|uniref:Uncharacterized protein n=1 Tax=Anguilla anguilla TaxID=7936 RepID=A0A9D3M1V7_ANGAN|nr:hypothetical protein ANANG_G00201380 [Anguilla anguilla]